MRLKQGSSSASNLTKPPPCLGLTSFLHPSRLFPRRLLLAAAVSDGHLAPEEQAEITALGQRSRALKALDNKTLGAINAEVTKRLRDRPKGLEEACQALPNDLRLPIFGHCVEIVLADGVLLQSEIEFLNKIMMHLDIAPADAQFLIKALLIKNRV